MKKNSILSSDPPRHVLNSSSDSIDSLIIPFWSVRDDHEDACGKKCPSAYKITSPTSDDEESASIQSSSDLSSYEPSDTYEHLFRPHTCCGSHVLDLLCEHSYQTTFRHSIKANHDYEQSQRSFCFYNASCDVSCNASSSPAWSIAFRRKEHFRVLG